MEFVRMTAKQFREMLNPQKTNKYNAIKTEADGIVFDSKFEAEKWNELKMLERIGIIKDLQRQVRFILLDEYVNNKGEKIRPISYIADFCFFDMKKKQNMVMDTKSVATKNIEVYRIKKKLFEYKYPEYVFVEITKK